MPAVRHARLGPLGAGAVSERVAFGFLWTLGSAVGLVLRVQGPFVPFLCLGAVFTVLGVVLPGWAGRAGWRDSAFMLDWLHERLQVS